MPAPEPPPPAPHPALLEMMHEPSLPGLCGSRQTPWLTLHGEHGGFKLPAGKGGVKACVRIEGFIFQPFRKPPRGGLWREQGGGCWWDMALLEVRNDRKQTGTFGVS